MSPFERWSLLVAFTGIVINIVVFGALARQLFLISDQVRQAREATDKDHERRRKQATLDFYAATFGQQTELRRVMPNSFDTEAISEMLEKAIAGDEPTLRQIGIYLSLHEHIAAGVRADVFDLSVLAQSAGTRFMAVYKNYRPWIEHIRQKNNDPSQYEELEWLADALAKYCGKAGRAMDEPYRDPTESRLPHGMEGGLMRTIKR